MWTILDSSIGAFNLFGNASSIQMTINIIIVILIFLWIVAIIWTARDISARSGNIFFQIISVLFVTFLTPIIGLPLYLAMRPVGLKKDRIPWREATASNLIMCYNCSTFNPKTYNCCIACGEKLKIDCKECKYEYAHDYLYCPECGAPNIEIE